MLGTIDMLPRSLHESLRRVSYKDDCCHEDLLVALISFFLRCQYDAQPDLGASLPDDHLHPVHRCASRSTSSIISLELRQQHFVMRHSIYQDASRDVTPLSHQ